MQHERILVVSHDPDFLGLRRRPGRRATPFRFVSQSDDVALRALLERPAIIVVEEPDGADAEDAAPAAIRAQLRRDPRVANIPVLTFWRAATDTPPVTPLSQQRLGVM